MKKRENKDKESKKGEEDKEGEGEGGGLEDDNEERVEGEVENEVGSCSKQSKTILGLQHLLIHNKANNEKVQSFPSLSGGWRRQRWGHISGTERSVKVYEVEERRKGRDKIKTM
ncbi:hypothetical protein M8J77_021851 [Diaphorina citri]|nr:hypothetical protein M8J77_021851 [Diaphorina citri]